jgi:hypothetical protein
MSDWDRLGAMLEGKGSIILTEDGEAPRGGVTEHLERLAAELYIVEATAKEARKQRAALVEEIARLVPEETGNTIIELERYIIMVDRELKASFDQALLKELFPGERPSYIKETLSVPSLPSEPEELSKVRAAMTTRVTTSIKVRTRDV